MGHMRYYHPMYPGACGQYEYRAAIIILADMHSINAHVANRTGKL